MPKSEEREEQLHVSDRNRPSQQEGKSLRKRLIGRAQADRAAFRTSMAGIGQGSLGRSHFRRSLYPVEAALVRGDKRGWRASEAGTQLIRLIFDRPRNIERIELEFDENEAARTQEFVLRWMPNMGQPREIVRQQWNFSPPATVHQSENFSVRLSGASTLELIITPNIGSGRDRASLSQLRLA